MKPYKTVDEQIAILESRKMMIPDKGFARTVLTYENYYYVINGYKAPFISSTAPDDTYKDGTTFDELFALYSFDRKLREILFPDLLRIEHSVKAKIIDVFSSHHGHDHTSYLHPDSFNTNGFENFRRTNSLIFDMLKLIDKQRKVHDAVKHYMDSYNSVPLWVLSKVMTFGKLNSFFACMLKQDKDEVASAFNISAYDFKSLVDLIAIFRNKCAHSERIYCHIKDQARPRPIHTLPIHQKLNIPSNSKGYKYGTQDVLALLIAMKYFLQRDRYRHLIEHVSYALNQKLALRLQPVPYNIIKDTMGLIGNWEELSTIDK